MSSPPSQQSPSRRWIGVALAALLVCGAVAWKLWPATASPTLRELAERTTLEPLELQDPDGYWRREGFVRMVPPVRLPSGSPNLEQIEVWLKLPEGAVIEVVDGPNGPTLEFPAGTISDRVEYVGEGDKRFVGDVRGTRFGPGQQRFRILRPVRPGPRTSLHGYEWVRGNRAHKSEVDTQMLAFLGDTPPGKNMSPPAREKYFKWFAGISNCAGCHGPNKPANRTHRAGGLPNRGTDASGMYTPVTVLASETPIETYRPHDLNRTDPAVSIACPTGQPNLTGPHATCPKRQVPIATLDLAAALARGDKRAHELCRARRYLYQHLSPRGQSLFSAAVKACPDS
ncbi:MAG: hypothetical protein ACPG4T_08145 [Nannocystaceae bacterium]